MFTIVIFYHLFTFNFFSKLDDKKVENDNLKRDETLDERVKRSASLIDRLKLVEKKEKPRTITEEILRKRIIVCTLTSALK